MNTFELSNIFLLKRSIDFLHEAVRLDRHLKQKVEVEQLEDREVAEDVEEIFEEDTDFSNDDEALAAMEFFAETSA